MGAAEMAEVADCVSDLLEALAEQKGDAALDAIRERTLDLTDRFPLPYGLR
jgi:glycine/serine hydroxymethyltransferase